MAKIDLTRDIKKVFAEQKRKANKVMAMAMNMTAKQVKEELIEEMKKIFDNPTPFTLNSLFVIPAKPDKLIVAIKIKDFAGKGTPASKYLSAQIEGGTRTAQGKEKKLRNIGKLNPNKYAMPGKGVKLNKYGNIPGSKITQILSSLKAFEEVGYQMNRTKDSIKRNPNQNKYFVIHDGSKSHLKPGVYYRSGKNGKNIKPILMFTKAPHYNKKFKFYELSVKHYKAKLQSNVNKASSIVFG